MKIICIENNYSQNLFNDEPEPVFFLKPDTSILTNNRPFFVPEFAETISCRAELVIKINRLGKYIHEKYANTYYNEIAMGVNFRDKKSQKILTNKGMPWERSNCFENGAAISCFIPLEEIKNIYDLNIKLIKNETQTLLYNTSDMRYRIDKLISYLSQFFTLKIGDLIFLGSPDDIQVDINDMLQIELNTKQQMCFRIK